LTGFLAALILIKLEFGKMVGAVAVLVDAAVVNGIYNEHISFVIS